MERLLSLRMGPQGEQNAGTFSIWIDDYQWSCANTIVAKLAVALAPMPFEGLLDRFVAATSGVSQTTKSGKTECSTLRLVKLARTVLPLSGKWTGIAEFG